MEVPIKELVADQKLIVLHKNDTMDKALTRLREHRITSAPVVDVDIHAQYEGGVFEGGKVLIEKRHLLGFVDTLDILARLVAEVIRNKFWSWDEMETHKLTRDDIQLIHKRSDTFRVEEMFAAINASHRNPCIKVDGNVTVREVINRYLVDAHRVAVFDSRSGLMLGVLTQSDVINHIHRTSNECCKTFPDLNEALENSLLWKGRSLFEVKTVVGDKIAINAFILMHNERVSCLPVVDRYGKVVDLLSASDVKYLSVGELEDLRLPLSELIPKARSVLHQPYPYLITATLRTTVLDLVQRFIRNQVHRVVIVDDCGKFLHIVTLSDILRGLSDRPDRLLQQDLQYVDPWSGFFLDPFDRKISPWRQMARIQEQIDRLRELFGSNVETWAPPVDIKESPKYLTFLAELPGFSKENILVEVDPKTHTLVISGERPLERLEKGKYRKLERKYGKFRRVFSVPEGANAEGVSAKMDEGILEVRVAKPGTHAPQTRKISIW